MKGSFAFSLLGVLLVVFLVGCVSHSRAEPPVGSSLLTVPPNKEWLACTVDAACSATWLSCHGWIAINGSYEADVQRWYSSANAERLGVVECSGRALPRPATRCRQGTCTRE